MSTSKRTKKKRTTDLVPLSVRRRAHHLADAKHHGSHRRRLARKLAKLLNHPLAPRIAHALSGRRILGNLLRNVAFAGVGGDRRDGRGEVEGCEVGRVKADVDEVDDAANVWLEGCNGEVEVDAPGVLRRGRGQ